MSDTTVSNHNHFTRDFRPRGQCPACDVYWAKAAPEQEFADDYERNEHG